MELSRKQPWFLLTLIGFSVTTSHAAIIINEFDYDQPGSDTAEFIELFNTGSTAVSLDDYTIKLINGSNASTYRTINLSGFSINTNEYFVICNDAGLVANCNYSFTSSNSWLQNGSPDAIALFEDSDLLDSVSYEGLLFPYTEGDALVVLDGGSNTASISRFYDSNNNAFDYDLGCITPGSANIAGTGNCSLNNISAVPIPAAAWLFGSGLLGLISLARREKIAL